jgi:hypothetical protein
MTTHFLAGALAGLLAAADPFLLLAPVITISNADRRDLERGLTVARTLKGGPGQVGVFAMSKIDVPAETLIVHARAIEDLKRSSFVTAIRRFSNPPRIEDFDELVLSPRDRQMAAECAIGVCSFKFTATEIRMLQDAIAAGGANRDMAIDAAFRRVVLARATAYLAAGLPGLPEVVNRSTPVCLESVFAAILAATPMSNLPCATEWLREVPRTAGPVESFLYWSHETYSSGKPVVVVTHMGLFAPSRPGDPAIVVAKQVFASRYMTGGLAITAIVTDATTRASYLMYLNRTSVDLLTGLFGSLKRSILESRLKGELPDIIEKLRSRLERSALPMTR